jgi:hypothetical protein
MITCILLQYIECLSSIAMPFSFVAISRALHRVAFGEDYGKRGSARAAVFGAFGPDEGASKSVGGRTAYTGAPEHIRYRGAQEQTEHSNGI